MKPVSEEMLSILMDAELNGINSVCMTVHCAFHLAEYETKDNQFVMKVVANEENEGRSKCNMI